MPVILRGRLARPDRAATTDSCPIERAMRTVGTRSAILLLREAAYGTTRFDAFVRRTGLTEAVTSSRLRELVDAGLLTKQSYREAGQRERQEYVLSESGRDLLPALLGLAAWGAKHAPRRGTPTMRHDGCGEAVSVQTRCAAGHLVRDDEIVLHA